MAIVYKGLPCFLDQLRETPSGLEANFGAAGSTVAWQTLGMGTWEHGIPAAIFEATFHGENGS